MTRHKKPIKAGEGFCALKAKRGLSSKKPARADANKSLLKDLCHLFLHFMRDTKTVSEHTLKAYKTDLYEWFDIKKQKEAKLPPPRPKPVPPSANKIDLKKSLQNCMETGRHLKLSPASRNRKTASLRSFIKWLREQNYIDEDMRFLFKTVKTVPQIPSFLSVDEIHAILEMFDKEDESPLKNRDQALFFLLYGGGLRISEACRMKIGDIDFFHHNVKVKGKGGRERMVPLPKKVFPSLKKLCRGRPGQSFLFEKPLPERKAYDIPGLPDAKAVGLFEKPLPERKAYDIVKGIGLKTGLLKPLHPHALRHSFATHLLTGGADLRILQELLGHKSLSATQKYTHLDLNHLSATLEQRHPLYQKKAKS